KENEELEKQNGDVNPIIQGRKTSDTPSPRKRSKATEELENMVQKLTEDDTNYKFAGIKSYIIYIKSAGGYCFALAVFVAFLAFVFSQIFTKVWLQHWIDSGDGLYDDRKKNATETNDTLSEYELRGYVNENPDLHLYLIVLLFSVIASYLIGMAKGFLSTRLVLWGASRLHGQMFDRVIGSPIGFFDRTPSGKILNRFSKDMDELDARMPFFVEFVVQSGLFVIANFLVVCFVYPIFSVGLLVIFAVMIFLDVWLNYGVRETKRLEVVLKTPVIHHLQSSMGGLSIIRTFSRQDNFKIRFSNYLNRHLSAETVFRFAARWFTVRIEFVGLFTIVGTILLAVLFRGRVSSAMVGLALASIYTVCTFVPFVLRMKSELQARFISVERILEYSEDLEQEESDDSVLVKPPEKWPQEGKIDFEGVTLRYKDDASLVFNGVSFSIKSNEKIGIVGRTGAGKTSVLSTLLRLYPIENGKVIIDGIDISQISLQDLRSSIAVIPQDPVLFQGTVRYNIDPFDEYSDSEVWSVLESSQLKNCIERDEKRLFAAVSANGDNFSVGEKQLICLCRAMLRKNKILLLDEATASLDIETDFKIQKIIREAFSACTVITVAHRLNTVANYDRILVMDSGKVIEFDSPEELMKQENSMFRKMVEASGVTLTNVQTVQQSQEIPGTNDTQASNTEESVDK
ncbi:Multidrug resistance-associated protein 5, partial [Orchesella cincta]